MIEPQRKVDFTRKSKLNPGLGMTWGATLRNGFCENDGERFKYKYKRGARHVDKEVTPYKIYYDRITVRQPCKICGGLTGQLIVRQAMIEPPAPPKCIKPSCLWKYVRNTWRYALIAIYHEKRTAYAQANRPEKIKKPILERYRTGEPSPATFIEAIIANIKIRCPVCRKVNTSW